MEKINERYRQLLKKRDKALEKVARAKERLGHPHLDFMSAHDLAEQEFYVWSAHLEEIEKEIKQIESGLKMRKHFEEEKPRR